MAGASFDWVPIPAGEVQRGTPPAEIADVVARHADLRLPTGYFAKEAPRSAISVPAFEILRCPVTRAQWNEFAAQTPDVDCAPPGDQKFPMDGVAWADAVRFANWMADRTGERIVLPSEIQWERAARGDDTHANTPGVTNGIRRLRTRRRWGSATTCRWARCRAGRAPSACSTSQATSMNGRVISTSPTTAPRPTCRGSNPGPTIRMSPAAARSGRIATSHVAHAAMASMTTFTAPDSDWCVSLIDRRDGAVRGGRA